MNTTVWGRFEGLPATWSALRPGEIISQIAIAVIAQRLPRSRFLRSLFSC